MIFITHKRMKCLNPAIAPQFCAAAVWYRYGCRDHATRISISDGGTQHISRTVRKKQRPQGPEVVRIEQLYYAPEKKVLSAAECFIFASAEKFRIAGIFGEMAIGVSFEMLAGSKASPPVAKIFLNEQEITTWSP